MLVRFIFQICFYELNIFLQVEDSDELRRLQKLYDAVYDQAHVWFQNLKIRFHNQILQHFGPMPEREADIQVIMQCSTVLSSEEIYLEMSALCKYVAVTVEFSLITQY